MHATYPHGVGMPGARDKTDDTPVTSVVVDSSLYAANAKSDRDNDGIACEQS
ncbi:MAG: excalibur calcium-binding domain-containing protein [Angustibacter sp.]